MSQSGETRRSDLVILGLSAMAKTVTFTLSEMGLGSEGWHGLTWVSTGSFLLLHWEQTEARGEHERRMGGPAQMLCSHPGKGGSGVPPWQLRKRWGVVDSAHDVKDTVRWIRDWEKEVLRVTRRCLVWSHLTWDEKEQDWGLTIAFTMWRPLMTSNSMEWWRQKPDWREKGELEIMSVNSSFEKCHQWTSLIPC